MIRHFTASAIILREGHVLLIEHRKAGLMLPPGGHIEPDEDPVQTIHREVREEVGLDVEIVAAPGFTHPTATTLPPPFTIHLIDNVIDPAVGPHTHIDLVYICRPLSSDVRLNGREIGGHVWAPVAEVGKLNTPTEMASLVDAAARFMSSRDQTPPDPLAPA